MIIAELLNPHLPSCHLGEGPHWDSSGHLYWVDIKGRSIHRYHLESKNHEICRTSSDVGFAIPDKTGRVIAGLKDGIYAIDFETGEETKLVSPLSMTAHDRFNDGKCDSAGRLWAGTMNESENDLPSGKLYCFDGTQLVAADDNFKTANGKGWSPDQKIMYHADTDRQTIWQYDFNQASGALSSREVFAKIDKDDGFPDGLCVDAQGLVYVSLFSGSKVRAFDPGGNTAFDIHVPVPQVTSCTFGGPDLKTLFITTAEEGLTHQELVRAPQSGQVFVCHMKEQGLPSYPFVTLQHKIV